MISAATIIFTLLLAASASPITNVKETIISPDILETTAEASKATAPNPKSALPKGYKVQYVGHSFHVHLAPMIEKLAREAGIQGHTTLGNEMLPASYPCQHWERNPTGVKGKLQAGSVDLLTLATRELAPDECVGKFAELAFKNNKNVRVMLQETWLPVSLDPKESCTAAKVGPGEKDPRVNGCTARDATNLEGLEKTRKGWEEVVRNKLRTQLQGINQKAGVNFTGIVTTWDGIISLREAVVQGKVPGVAKQTSLFMDPLGHPTTPLKDFTSYMWFSAMYGISPIGSKILGGSAAQQQVLQTMAWEHVKKEPLNGGMIKGD